MGKLIQMRKDEAAPPSESEWREALRIADREEVQRMFRLATIKRRHDPRWTPLMMIAAQVAIDPED